MLERARWVQPAKTVKRASMSLANVAYNPAFTWGDATVRTLESQMRLPLFNEHPVEMASKATNVSPSTPCPAMLCIVISSLPHFRATGRDSVDHLIKAIAAFERSLISGRSPFDRYVFDDDPRALSDSAKRGMTLFSRHESAARNATLPQFFRPLVYEGHEQGRAIFANTGLYDLDGRGSYPRSDRGLMDVSHKSADHGQVSRTHLAKCSPHGTVHARWEPAESR